MNFLMIAIFILMTELTTGSSLRALPLIQEIKDDNLHRMYEPLTETNPPQIPASIMEKERQRKEATDPLREKKREEAATQQEVESLKRRLDELEKRVR